MTLVLVTDRDWFPAALGGMLQEEWDLRRIGALGELRDAARSGSLQQIDAVLIDAHVEGGATPAAVRELSAGPLSSGVPILVYSAGRLEDDLYSNFLEAGAWNVVEGPIRSARFLALLRRLTAIGGRSREGHGNELPGAGDAHLPEVEGLLERLPVVEAIAKRENASIAVMAIGPTVKSEHGEYRGREEEVADLRRDAIRKSDLCAWLDAGEDFVVVAYSASREGAEVLAERISKAATERLDMSRSENALSVGVVELQPEDLPDQIRAEARSDPNFAVLSRARSALEEARESGGGVRFSR